MEFIIIIYVGYGKEKLSTVYCVRSGRVVLDK